MNMKKDRTVTTVIDPEKCIGCGLCIPVCPKETIGLNDGKACIIGDESLNCGHCAAACPEGAITVGMLDPRLAQYETFSVSDRWIPHGEFDTGALVNLMQSRRSCRNFKNKPVEPGVLEDLVKIGITAPSGSNCQLWSFTILPDRDAVIALAEGVGRFFERLNRMAEKAWLRSLLKLVNKPTLADYYANYYQTIKEAFDLWKTEGKDILFHGATAVIVVGSRNDATCPAEDALLATQNILLGAHAMGLGTCLIGYVIEAMQRDRRINRSIGLPDDETPYAVVALGYPGEQYDKVAGRKRVSLRYAEPLGASEAGRRNPRGLRT
jgi:nitroreductase/NAD-dependent dihydropyrimidine dehydrogenase PreA subunit